MASQIRYDAHCHIFNLDYALKEIKNMVHDVLHGTYPWMEPPAHTKEKESVNKTERIKLLIRWLFELIHAAGSSEQENLNFLQREAQKVYPADTLRIYPLMMDIFYIYAYGLDKNMDLLAPAKAKVEKVEKEYFQKTWDEILDFLADHIKNLPEPASKESDVNHKLHVDRSLLAIENERNVTSVLSVKAKIRKVVDGMDYYHTEGYNYHLNNLMDLVQQRPNELFPFIAVDPRRPGIVDAVVGGSFFTGNRRFYGVKLYPRLGYHPQCKQLTPIYEFCQRNGIPITFHCGMSGFPPGIDWHWADFGNPIHFEPIVRQYPNLRINFAHMGSKDPNHKWEKTILNLINDPTVNNVYTDLSCYTSSAELLPMKSYWDNNPRLQNRLMFGTDFDVMYFGSDHITMNQYYKNFITVFGEYNLQRMMEETPKDFLRIF